MFKNHEITKIYTCLVKGVISENQGTIDMPISRSKTDRKKMAVSSDGKSAITHFNVIERFNKYTLLKVKLETGRTHQIRVHMAKINHPIVGDTTYGNDSKEFKLNGQLLHSTILEFTHPISKKEIHVEAPLPDYFIDVLNQLRS